MRIVVIAARKLQTRRVRVSDLIGEFFDALFNLDSKLFKTLKALAIPGKLSKEFIAGRRNNFYPPVRIFFVSVLIYFAFANWFANSNMFQLNGFESAKSIESLDDYFYIQSVMDTTDLDFDSSEQQLIQRYNDSVYVTIFKDRDSTDFSLFYPTNSSWFSTVMVSLKDIATMTPDSLANAYIDSSRIAKFQLARSVKMFLDPKGAVQSIASNISWMFILCVPIIALWMYLLYRRRNWYYSEHVVVLMHFSSFLFILGAVLLFLEWLTSWTFLNTIALFGLIYPWIELKKVYGQHWLKTTLKYVSILFATIISFMISSTLVALGSLILSL